MERRAAKHIARQDGLLLRAVARVWKARERGKLLERVKATRLLKSSLTIWKGSVQRRKEDEGELLISISLVGLSSSFR